MINLKKSIRVKAPRPLVSLYTTTFMIVQFITFMVSGFITFVVKSYHIYGFYYIYG